MVARTLNRFESNVIPVIEESLTSVIEVLKKHIPATKTHLIRPINVDTLQNSVQSASQTLLREFVRDTGTHLSLMIRKGVETPDWSVMKEPGDVRLATELVANEFKSILQEVSQVFPFIKYEVEEYNSRDRYSLSALHQLTGAPKSPIIGGIVDSNTNAIVSGVAKIGLKSFIECVRLCTFNTFGYQQMQVDVQYLRIVWSELKFDSESMVETMLDDVLESTSWRCAEPLSMSKKVTYHLLK